MKHFLKIWEPQWLSQLLMKTQSKAFANILRADDSLSVWKRNPKSIGACQFWFTANKKSKAVTDLYGQKKIYCQTSLCR